MIGPEYSLWYKCSVSVLQSCQAKFVVEPWARCDRIICVNPYFVSISTANELQSIDQQFIVG